MPLFREVAGPNWDTAASDETTVLRFRRLLEEHKRARQNLALINDRLGARGLLRMDTLSSCMRTVLSISGAPHLARGAP